MINSISKKQLKKVKESTNNLTTTNKSITNTKVGANKPIKESATKSNTKLSIYQQLSAINSSNANTTIKESSESSKFNIYKELSKINSALNNMVLESNSSNNSDTEIDTVTYNNVPNTINDVLDDIEIDIDKDDIDTNNYVVNNLTIDDLVDFYNTLINGGLSKIENTTERNVDIKELRKGIEVEMEHVNKNSKFAKQIATKITLDHLTELPDYYTRLETIENS